MARLELSVLGILFTLLCLGRYLVHPCFRIVRLAHIHRLLPAAFSEMEVPIRSSLRQPAVLLAPVGAPLELEDPITVVAALHHGAQWPISQLLPPAVYGFLQLVYLLGIHLFDEKDDGIRIYVHA